MVLMLLEQFKAAYSFIFTPQNKEQEQNYSFFWVPSHENMSFFFLGF